MKYKTLFPLTLALLNGCSQRFEMLHISAPTPNVLEDSPSYQRLERELALRDLPAKYAQRYDSERFSQHDILLFLEREISPEQANVYNSCFYSWEIADFATPVIPKERDLFDDCVGKKKPGKNNPHLECMVPRVPAKEANKHCDPSRERTHTDNPDLEYLLELLMENQQKFRKNIIDPQHGISLLQENEYVLSSEVFKAVRKALSPNKGTSTTDVKGLYFPNDRTLSEYKIFRRELEKISLTDDERTAYEFLFQNLKGKILYHQNVFSGDFRKVVVHERTHRYIDWQTNKNEKNLLDKTYQEMKEELFFYSLMYRMLNPNVVSENYDEFFSYLVDGTIPQDTAEPLLMENYPEAYKLYNRMKEQVKSSL